MTDNELLMAISDIFDKKIKGETEPIKTDIGQVKADIAHIKTEQTRINMIIENEIREDIRLLAENYLPAAKRYEKATSQIEAMLADIDVMKKVIREHSEMLQRIS